MEYIRLQWFAYRLYFYVLLFHIFDDSAAL